MKLSILATLVFGFSSILPNYANVDRVLVATTDGRKRRSKKSSKSKSSKKNSKKCSAKSSKSTTPTSAVYTMTNLSDGNEIAMFERDIHTGLLQFRQTTSTGGLGGRIGESTDGVTPAPVDDPLGSTGSLIVAGRCLLAVNTGSNTVSSFHISSKGRLTLADQQSSGGEFPVSLAEYEGLVYVVNAGLDGSLSGFNLLQYSCSLVPIADSFINLELDTGLTSGQLPFLGGTPSQIQANPNGNFKVSIKGFGNNVALGLGRMLTYRINKNNGKLSEINDLALTDSNVPFSFDITSDGTMLLTEAFGNDSNFGLNTGAITIVGSNGVQTRLKTTQDTTCWLEYSETTGCIFTTNTGGFSMSSALLKNGNKLILKEALLDDLGGPIDLKLSPDDEHLYVIANNNENAEGNTNGMPAIYAYDATSCHCDAIQLQAITEGLPTEFTSGGNPTPGYNGIAGLAVWQS